jgi:hypothetical protein
MLSRLYRPIPRFKQLMKSSEKLVAYHTFFLLEVLVVLLLLQNTAQAATPGDPLEAINRPIMHFNTRLKKPIAGVLLADPNLLIPSSGRMS